MAKPLLLKLRCTQCELLNFQGFAKCNHLVFAVSAACSIRPHQKTLEIPDSKNSATSKVGASLSFESCRQDFQHSFAELRQIIGLSAADEVTIDDDWRVFPDCSGVDQVVLDSR
jgi:hypothetical protein